MSLLRNKPQFFYADHHKSWGREKTEKRVIQDNLLAFGRGSIGHQLTALTLIAVGNFID